MHGNKNTTHIVLIFKCHSHVANKNKGPPFLAALVVSSTQNNEYLCTTTTCEF